MRASAILAGLNNLQDDEELTAKAIVQWIIESLDMGVSIPDFTIDSTGCINNGIFWNDLETKTANKVVSMLRLNEIDEVLKAIENVFRTTIERENALACWLQISRFLNDLQNKCSNSVFMIVSTGIGTTLLNEFLTYPDFDKNKMVLDSMFTLWCCGSVLSRKVKLRTNTIRDVGVYMYTHYINRLNEYFDLIGRNLIFVSNTFYPITTRILLNGNFRLDAKQLTKYLNAIDFTLMEPGPAAENVVKFCKLPESKGHFLKLTLVSRRYVSNDQCRTTLNILHKLLEYSRETNVPCDFDWTLIFSGTLFTKNYELNQSALKVFLFEAERTEDGQQATQYTWLEKVVKAYRRFHDDQNMTDATMLQRGHKHLENFICMFEEYEHFVTSEKLFFLLRENVTDNLAMCLVIIDMIKYVASRLAEHSDRHVNLMKEILRHVEFVKPHPHLMCRLINILDIDRLKESKSFPEELVSIETVSVEAFFMSLQYGTAIESLDILKSCGFSVNALNILIVSLTEKMVNNCRSRQMPILLLAFDDSFNVFQKFNSSDRCHVYKYYKKQFQDTVDVEIKAIYVALNINVLIGFDSAPDVCPEMPPETIANEARLYFDYICEQIINKQTNSLFALMMLGMTLFVYHASFKSSTQKYPMHIAFETLSIASSKYYQSFTMEAKQVESKDFHLITKYWRCAIALFEKKVKLDIVPRSLFDYYGFDHDRFVEPVKTFIIKVLECEKDEARYDLFADCIYFCVKVNKPVSDIKPLVKKLFRLVAEHPVYRTDLPIVGLKVFWKHLLLFENKSDRPKTVFSIQKYLYEHILEDSHRYIALTFVNEKISSQSGANRKSLEELLKSLRGNTNIEEEDNDEREERPDDDERDETLRSSSPLTRYRPSNSLPSINASIVQSNE